MTPVLDELDRSYTDKLVVTRINTGTDLEKAQALDVTMVPTEIFYSPDGREIFRHIGFYSAEEIVHRWKKLGFDLGQAA